MKKTLSFLFSVAVVFLPWSDALGWSGGGHMVIAAEAWRELSPQMRTNVTQLLKSHPDYQKWQSAYAADTNNTVDLATFIFVRCSPWPDEIRRRGCEYDHAEWHYVDYPLHSPRFGFEAAPSPTNDIVYGIAQCERILSDTNAPAQDRAAYLSFLVHMIGDLHQPMHCSSYYGESFPTGDRGGNEFYIKPAERGIKLHSFWDGLLGRSATVQDRLNYAIQLQSEYSRKSLKELRKAVTARDWSLESRKLAIKNGYLKGRLKVATSADAAEPLPDGYAKKAKEVAEHQAALAGYRLADEILMYLK
jgi:hypothetical protein